MFWLIMEKYVNVIHPETIDDLKEALIMAWNSVSIDIINKLYESFINRCFLCLHNRGKSIQHLIKREMDCTVNDDEINELFDQLQTEKN